MKSIIYILLSIIILNECQAGVIDITKRQGADYVYALASQRTVIGQCSPTNFYMNFKLDLPAQYKLIGHVLGSPENNYVSDPDYPQVYADGPNPNGMGDHRAKYWPINPPWPIGLHWLCGTPAFYGIFRIDLPTEIKIRGDNNNVTPPEDTINLTLQYLGKYSNSLGVLGTYNYKLKSSPPMVATGRVLSENELLMKAGELRKVLWFEGQSGSQAQICWRKVNNEVWYDVVNNNGVAIYNNCLTTDMLPIYVKISDRPPIGTSIGSLEFKVTIQ